MASAEPRESGLDGVYTTTYMYVCEHSKGCLRNIFMQR